MKRDFNQWLATFRGNIAGYDYYVDFQKVYGNVDAIKVPLNILNSLVGSKNIHNDFIQLASQYPETIRCIPILLAVRKNQISAIDENGEKTFYFSSCVHSAEEYAFFMEKTGLFHLLSERIVRDLIDYVTGVETGLDSNGRKNRGGHVMENLVEQYIQKAGFSKDENYFKEMYISDVQHRFNVDMSNVSNNGTTEKRFDFVVKTQNQVYVIETNFYTSGGSKLNETARSYKTLANEIKDISGVTFVWFTDGTGWTSARHNLKETFDVLDTVFNIHDLETGIVSKIFI